MPRAGPRPTRFAGNILAATTSWGDVLPNPPKGERPSAPGRALVIEPSCPTPDQDSGSLSTFNLLRLLGDLGFRVSFLPTGSSDRLPRYTDALESMGVDWLGAPYFTFPDVALASLPDDYDLVVLCRHLAAERALAIVRRRCPSARVIFRPVDLHFLREGRQAAIENSPSIAAAAAVSKSRELALVDMADATIVVSSYEADVLGRERPGAVVRTVPMTRDIPGRRRGPSGRRDILFLGSFAHLPNVDAVVWFAGEVFPLVRERLGDVSLHIVGKDPPPDVVALGASAGMSGRHPIVIHGYRPKIDELLDGCRLSVAPLRWGAGIKGKVATSLAAGLPCVATSVAVEGAGLVAGQEILVADAPCEIAAAIVRIYLDDALWLCCSEAGIAGARRQFSFAANRKRMAELFLDIGISAPASRSQLKGLRYAGIERISRLCKKSRNIGRICADGRADADFSFWYWLCWRCFQRLSC